MKKKLPAKQKDERTQKQRFIDFAKEHGATDDVLDQAIGDVAKDAQMKKN